MQTLWLKLGPENYFQAALFRLFWNGELSALLLRRLFFSLSSCCLSFLSPAHSLSHQDPTASSLSLEGTANQAYGMRLRVSLSKIVILWLFFPMLLFIYSLIYLFLLFILSIEDIFLLIFICTEDISFQRS